MVRLVHPSTIDTLRRRIPPVSCHDHDRDDAADEVMRLFAAMQGALHAVVDCGGLPRPAGQQEVREKKKKSTAKVDGKA